MLRITLAQMRRSLGRLTAAGIAIVIGTAFVAATLLAGNVITRTTYDAIAARYAASDVVVRDTAGMLTAEQVAAVAQADGVAAAEPVATTYLELTQGNRTVYQGVVGTTADHRFMPLTLTEGTWPEGAGEIALPPDVAERLAAQVGEQVTVVREVVGTDGTSEQVREPVTVSGLVDDPYGAYAMFGGAGVLDAHVVARWAADALPPGQPVTYGELLVALDASADMGAAQVEIARAVPGAEVSTPDEHAAEVAASLTGGEDLMFLVFVLTFAAIALLVAGLVIANTFQVLVAQRTRTLALLRCVGANKAQIGRGVLLEAGILGAVSSAGGVVLGAVLGQAALWVASTRDLGVPLPTAISLSWQVVVVPIVVGTLVTVVSALVPARVATRVAPLAALRPSDAPTAARGAGRLRLVLSVLATVVGLALLAGGAALGLVSEDPGTGLLLGVAGGAISFVGIAVGAVFWLPRVAALAGRLVGTSGPAARLAAANTLRNPRRTAATSTALLIGVTLVATMSTGAASARTSLTAALDTHYPVDVSIAAQSVDEDGNGSPLPSVLETTVAAVDGVAAVTGVTTAALEVQGLEEPLWVEGVDPVAAAAALRAPDALDRLGPGTVVVPQGYARNLELEDGDTLEVAGAEGTATLTVATTDAELDRPVIAQGDVDTLAPGSAVTTLWVALEDPARAVAVVRDVQDVVADTGEAAAVTGASVERAGYEQVIDTMLGIVLGLLAVAVVIALIGVANTLSLSVIERRRESATLRAIGLSKAQLRGTLAIEGLLIAGVGAVLGIALGLVYGWAGSAAALGVMGDVVLAVPWREIGLVTAVAVVAGLVASVVPARSAVRTSPVEALATE